MCESTVYILRDGQEELVLESVDILENSQGKAKGPFFGRSQDYSGAIIIVSPRVFPEFVDKGPPLLISPS